MTTAVIGRKLEKEKLKEFLHSNESEFMAIYGRRRVGKTFLVKNMIEQPGIHHCTITGLKDGSKNEQLNIFTQALEKNFKSTFKILPPENWFDAFAMLTKALDTLPKKQIIAIFVDEMPWMDTPKSGLLQALEHFWNTDWAYRSNLKLIVCGSAASWMLNNLIHAKGGLYNRLTSIMLLRPFTLAETELFLKKRNIQLNQKQICDLYMVMGGIPHYLKAVKKGLSAIQNINNICFSQSGILSNEFEKLYASLFKASDAHKEIIRTIAKHRYGLDQDALLNQLTLSSSGGSFTKRLTELEEAGFIVSFTPYQNVKKGTAYRIIDEYSLFYLTWIEPAQNRIKLDSIELNYWQTKSQTPAWRAWSGYAFETICYKHINQIWAALKIQVGFDIGTWRYTQKEGSTSKGAQIDLLFDREDGTITLCEMKYSDKPYRITKKTANELWDKLDVFAEQTKTKKQLFLAMVIPFGLISNFYMEELVSNTITLADLFQS